MSQRDDLEDDAAAPRRQAKSSGLSTMSIVLIALGIGGVFMCGGMSVLIALLLPAVQQARVAARTTQSKNNLKQIGLGLHNFHDVMQHFPPMGPKDLKPGEVPQSWMTELLPYMDQAAVYNVINRQAPWDDASNRRAISIIIPSYLDPNLPQETIDPLSGFGLAHYAGNSNVFGGETPLHIRDFSDGLTNTMLAGTVANGVRPWGDPANVRDPAAGIGPGPTQFSSGVPTNILILLGDGTVRSINKNVSPQVMEALAKPNDGVFPSSDF